MYIFGKIHKTEQLYADNAAINIFDKGVIFMDCKNCPFCDIITDKELTKRLKCTKTKRGKTITWSMCCVGTNIFQYFADYLEKHNIPKWCPLQNTNTDSITDIASLIEE